MRKEKLSSIQQEKREIVEQMKSKIQTSKSFVVIDYKGLNVAQDTELRSEFRKNKVEYKVLKNTLFRIALNELGHNEFDLALNGPTAIAFAEEDELASAKGAKSGVDKFKSLEIKCGMFGNKFADKNTVVALASVPDRQTLLSMLVSVLSAPMRGLAIALNAVAEKQAQ